MDVWIYTDASKPVDDVDGMKAFASKEAADKWVEEHDPKAPVFKFKPSLRIKLEPKDWAIFIPLVGSGLAITYQVGCFVPLGGTSFGLFSLSDHFIWALQALPVAMVAAAIVLLIATVGTVDRSEFIANANKRAWSRWALNAYAVAVYAGIAWYFRSIAASVFVVFFLVVTGMLPDAGPRLGAMRNLVLSATLFFLIVFVAALGADVTRYRLNHTAPSQFDFSGTAREMVLIRAGDHGLLLYDRSTQQLLFTKNDSFKEIKWRRAPIIPGSLWDFVPRI